MKISKGRLASLSTSQRQSILEAVRQENANGKAWAEKVRRFASLYGRNLQAKATERFGPEVNAHLQWMAGLLLEAAQHRTAADQAPIDQAMLSAALYCMDAIKTTEDQASRATAQLKQLQAWLERTAPPEIPNKPMGQSLLYQPGLWKKEAKNVKGLTLLCPSPYSHISLTVLELCISLKLPIDAIVIRKFTASRFAREWRRDGPRLIKKIWRKLVLRADENAVVTPVSLSQLSQALAPEFGDIRKTAKKHNIPLIKVAEFDDAIDKLAPYAPKTGLFTGGGMISKKLLALFENGVLNPHMGPLPHYKGMDVVQAPILEGVFNRVAITTHYMVPKLDAGPVFARFEINSDLYGSLPELRNEISAIMPLIAIDTALGIDSGRLQPQQQPQKGRQYYFAHPELIKIIAAIMPVRAQKATKTRQSNLIRETVSAVLKEFGKA